MFKNIVLLFFISFIFFACIKDKPNTAINVFPKDSTDKVLIVCEGSLGNGNADLSVYSPAKDSVYNEVFKSVNVQALGDIFQSICKNNNQYFFCVNNSDKIAVIDAKTWALEKTIVIPKPRNMLVVSAQKAYVGSLFSNKIFVINMQTYTVEKQIQMPFQNVEGMLLKDGMVYVCCWDTACNKLYQIDPNTDVLADSIKLAGAAPQSVVQDKEQKLWVMGGNAPKNKNTTMTRIDLVTKTVIQKYTFAAGVEAIKPCLNPNKDSIYFIEVNYSGAASNNGIYRMPIEAKFLPNEPFISCVVNQYFWALGIDGKSGNIYVGDPKGFVQKGGVSIYSPQANLLHQFNVGLGVSSFYFD